MSYVIAILLVGISTALLLRVGRVWLILLGLAAVLLALVPLGAHPLVLLQVALLGVASMWTPRSQTPVRPKARPRPQAKAKTNPKISLSNGLTGGGNVSGLEATYDILEKVGIGGMATVYKARAKKDSRIVALKIPQEKYVGDARFVRRFHREAELLAHLDHPGIVKVYDHGNHGDTHYIAMEFLDGEGLDRLIENKKLSVPNLVEVMGRVAEALQHIHAQGIIHRDIKPGNIMVLRNAVREDGSVDPRGVRLMDFGIAAGKVLTRLTITGARIGTPVYMSPEQAKGQRIDHKSDIYSFGVVFYEALTGQPPFQGAYEAVIHQQITQMPAPPKQVNPDIPQALSDLVYRMLEKDPEKRPGLEAILEVLRGKWNEDPGLSAPVYLALALETKKGTLRLMDPQGTLARMWSGVGSGRGMFPSPPLALTTDDKHGFWISLFEYGGGAVRLIHRFDLEGEITASIAPYGMKLGELLYPVSLAAVPSGLLVLDGETCTITHFDRSGNPTARFGGAGPGRGLFDAPKAIVASPDYVFVLDSGNRQIQRLTHDGQYLSRYAFRKSKESQELRLLAGVGVTPDHHLLIYDADGQKIRKLSLEGEVISSWPLPLEEGEDASAQVEMVVQDEILYAIRRGASKVHRLGLGGQALPSLEVYAPLRGIALWRNPKVHEAGTERVGARAGD
ncbi:serine/threonine-protein kinase [Meiothermus granaticius]|uniref:non-specific serine/threonine protein kinase n=1 Tax=Meiothermus granaticius NBRC 107808 TaxID=1227551 RepID=A0A399F8A4_9DEIN|nr:serine/threonine-protein kinase [Meiothermus granaticius]MCL6526627.1 protein kinase [Thermaceae bacterium]RIH92323.1 Serine/threonine-protein kinase PknB [Meiothermus granaticius NBRC 107808]GEM88060.1 serine/threonine protein kinase [Meiothermus granaticius NBRC 107808]